MGKKPKGNSRSVSTDLKHPGPEITVPRVQSERPLRGRIRYWNKQTFMHYREIDKGSLWWFDFQDVLFLRTVRELRQQGVSLGTIRKCAEKLRRKRPHLQQPLAEVCIFNYFDQVVVQSILDILQ